MKYIIGLYDPFNGDVEEKWKWLNPLAYRKYCHRFSKIESRA